MPVYGEKGMDILTPVQIFTAAASMLGGLALFLYGMNTMSDSLSRLAGGVLDRVLNAITKNKFFAFIFGTVITAVVQSSSAVTVLTVGLVNSKIIELGQAVGLIVGANLGTTATSWLLSLNSVGGESFIRTLIKPSTFSPFLAVIGLEMSSLARSDKNKNIGSTLLGFGVMMIGMNVMSQAVSPLGKLPELQNLLMGSSNPIPAFLFAVLFTMIVQSSDATVGIIQAFSVTLFINFGTALPLICGAQVGTCITALLSSMGASNSGKRTAILNLYYNLLKVIPFMIIFYLINSIFNFSFLDSSVGGIGIPLVHSLINVIGAAVWLTMSKLLVFLVNKTIPMDKTEKEEQENILTILDPLLIRNPKFALEQTDNAVRMLAKTTQDCFVLFRKPSERSDDAVERIRSYCRRTKNYREQIDKYLADISVNNVNPSDASYIAFLSGAAASFYRISVMSAKTVDVLNKASESDVFSSDYEKKELLLFGSAINEILDITVRGFGKKTLSLAAMIRIYREVITEMNDKVKKRRIIQMHGSYGKQEDSELFAELYHIREQIIDDCDSVADELIRYLTSTGKADLADIEIDDAKRAVIQNLFLDKFEILETE